jgi:hypothetical protein
MPVDGAWPARWRAGVAAGMPLPALAAAVALVSAGGTLLIDARPLYAAGLAVLGAFAFFPTLCRVVLVAAVAIGPTFNPPVLGLGGGRVYLVQSLLLCTFAGAVALAARNGMHRRIAVLLACAGAFVAIETLGREHAGIAWVYRPLQVFFVAATVGVLFKGRSAGALVRALAWGSVVGCTLASAHALVPAFDPFRLSRPDDIPYVSAIASFARATGAFTYPNNLGTYAAYAVLLGAAAWLFDRPRLPRGLAAAVMVSGAAALLLAGSRAAGLGLLCGLLYLTYRAAPGRRVALVGGQVLIGIVVVTAVLASPTAREVSDQRIESATGSSLSIRVEDWRGALADFRASPLVGTGASESRTDNFWILYLAQAGVLGVVVLAAMARTAFADRREGDALAPEMRVALLLALCVSGLLQDSLGQTLASWFLGALLGVSLLARPAPAPASPPLERQRVPQPSP